MTQRRAGWFVRVGARVSPGIRKVQAEIEPYAAAWEEVNRAALRMTGPLWVTLGDSMSQGIGASRYDLGWVGQLRVLLDQAGQPYRLVNLSSYGARVRDVLTRQLPAMRDLDAAPDLVTVLIGSNDLVSRRNRKNLHTDYDTLLRQLPSGAVVASPFGNFGLGRELNVLIAVEAARRGLRVVNNRDGASAASWRGKLSEDHFHPNDAGYAALAEDFFETILASS
jgi:lysophospholipase L1-like esterase